METNRFNILRAYTCIKYSRLNASVILERNKTFFFFYSLPLQVTNYKYNHLGNLQYHTATNIIYRRNKTCLERNETRLERNDTRLTRNETRSGNLHLSGTVPVKSKLQHPPPPPPGHLNFWKIFVQIPPPPPTGPKSCSNAPTPWRVTRLLS